MVVVVFAVSEAALLSETSASSFVVVAIAVAIAAAVVLELETSPALARVGSSAWSVAAGASLLPPAPPLAAANAPLPECRLLPKRRR